MAIRRPLKIDGANGLQEMSNADMAYIRYRTRTGFANLTENSSGWVNNTGTGTYLNIARDRYRTVWRTQTTTPAYGASGWTNIRNATQAYNSFAAPGTNSSTNLTLYQNRTSVGVPSDTIQDAGPLVAENGTDYANLVPMSRYSETDVQDTVVNTAIAEVRASTNNNGGLYITTGTVAGDYLVGSITDRRRSTASNAFDINNTYRLYMRRAETFTDEIVRPVRYDVDGGVREMTDAEIEDFFVPYFQRRAVSTNGLRYAFQGANPGGWLDRGTILDYYRNSTTQSQSGHTYYKTVSGNTFTSTKLWLDNA